MTSEVPGTTPSDHGLLTGDGRCVIAIDGPAGSGKSTVSRRLATALGACYLDTGAMYRAMTWAVLRDGVDLNDAAAIGALAATVDLRVRTDPDAPGVMVDQTGVDAQIRGPEVTAAVSAVAAVPAVRALLVAQQRAIVAAANRIVVEGRDIGQVVTPDADLKVFLTASVAARAMRRSAEHLAAPAAADVRATAQEIERRDLLDSTRAVDPLRPAADAVLLDTTQIGIDEVVARLVCLLREAMPA